RPTDSQIRDQALALPRSANQLVDAPARQAELSRGQIGRVMADPRKARQRRYDFRPPLGFRPGRPRKSKDVHLARRSIHLRAFSRADAFDTFRLAVQSALIDTRVSRRLHEPGKSGARVQSTWRSDKGVSAREGGCTLFRTRLHAYAAFDDKFEHSHLISAREELVRSGGQAR